MLFESILTTDSLTIIQYLICTGVSLIIGLVIALVFMYKSSGSTSFAITLVMLPAVVQTIILLVNGSLGIGVAVAGAFSLVRFRSVPGSAKELTAIFIAMATGLATGTGHLLLALIFATILCGAFFLLSLTGFGTKKAQWQELRIVVPESLDYTELFDDLLCHYTRSFELISVRTTNMGSLYELTYKVLLTGSSNPREFIDNLRTRNGNLKIVLGHATREKEEL